MSLIKEAKENGRWKIIMDKLIKGIDNLSFKNKVNMIAMIMNNFCGWIADCNAACKIRPFMKDIIGDCLHSFSCIPSSIHSSANVNEWLLIIAALKELEAKEKDLEGGDL